MSFHALSIKGMRTLADVRLELTPPGMAGGLTVLIGDNGSGKSTIIEACEILSKVPGEHFLDELHSVHGGLMALLRQGARQIELGLSGNIEYVEEQPRSDAGRPLVYEYQIVLAPQDGFLGIKEERLELDGERILARKGFSAEYRGGGEDPSETDLLGTGRGKIRRVRDLDPLRSLLTQVDRYHMVGAAGAILFYLPELIRRISVHLPFEVMPAWAARALDRKSALRSPTLIAPVAKLDKLGENLANAYHALKNGSPDRWQQTLDYVRLGLGQHIEDVSTWPDPGGGNIGLALKLRGLARQVPAAQISDGMLSYLAFVALYQLARGGSTSLLAFDEPDLHLHPHLLQRVLDLLEALAATIPVLLTTHSDRLLDGLSAPGSSVVLCELDEDQATRLWRPDADALHKWLARYRGIGDLRGEGYESAVMTRPVGRV